MLTPDSLLQNRYRVIRPLGRGGMGAVYEAFDLRLSRTVALKETLVESVELRRAFEREALLLANLRHPALPKVLDHFDEGTGLFLVMEFIPGEDLSGMLEGGRLFPPTDVLRWADQLLDALDYLHNLDPPVLHRDIKPANLKLISPHQIVLLDFGLAKGAAGQMAQTANRSVLGYSPNYSSMEQVQGTGTDQRSDLYSLGATLYHLMTGVKPPDALMRAAAIIGGQPDPLLPAHHVSPAVPSGVSAALMRSLALNVEHRPLSAAQMREDLRSISPPNAAASAATTIPITDANRTMGIPTPNNPVMTRPIESARDRHHQVVIPIPEETVVAGRRTHGLRAGTVAAGIAVLLAALASAVYFGFSDEPAVERAPSRKPTTGNRPVPTPTLSLSPSPSPTPDNTNSQIENTNSAAAPGPAELAARERLARRNIPYREEAFIGVISGGDTAAVDLFLAAGMNPNAVDPAGKSALMAAAARGRDNITRKLLTRGADGNARDMGGMTALMSASANAHQDTIKVLLDNGADVNITDAEGRTALMQAAANGHADVVRLLIESGARVNVKDRAGRDALIQAEKNGHKDVAELLRKAGASAR